MSKTFRSKTDAWVRVVLLGTSFACLLAVVFTPGDVGGVEGLIAMPVLLVSAGLPIWMLCNTRYVFDGNELRVHSGPFMWKVPVEEITHIEPTRSPLSSPALSLDRLRIKYAQGKSLLISPENRDSFLQELEAHRSGPGDVGR
jgi:hypothetical protein